MMFSRLAWSQKRGLISLISARAKSSAYRVAPAVQAFSHRTASPAVADVSVATRSFSTYSSGPPSSRVRAFPTYNVAGENALIQFKIIAPGFRLSRDNLSVDPMKRGRILIEFTPRGPDGSFHWADQVRVAISAEEVGLICNQLPHYEVSLTRVPRVATGYDGESTEGIASDGIPNKVLKATPGEGGTVKFSIDYVLNGVGGQSPGPGQEGKAGPLEVEVQLGEFEVIKALLKDSIPSLVGWSQLVDKSVQNAIADAFGGGGGGSARGVPF